jgi:hypothetical protein
MIHVGTKKRNNDFREMGKNFINLSYEVGEKLMNIKHMNPEKWPLAEQAYLDYLRMINEITKIYNQEKGNK